MGHHVCISANSKLHYRVILAYVAHTHLLFVLFLSYSLMPENAEKCTYVQCSAICKVTIVTNYLSCLCIFYMLG